MSCGSALDLSLLYLKLLPFSIFSFHCTLTKAVWSSRLLKEFVLELVYLSLAVLRVLFFCCEFLTGTGFFEGFLSIFLSANFGLNCTLVLDSGLTRFVSNSAQLFHLSCFYPEVLLLLRLGLDIESRFLYLRFHYENLIDCFHRTDRLPSFTLLNHISCCVIRITKKHATLCYHTTL